MKAPELVSTVLLKMADHVRPGVTTFTLDCLAEIEIKKLGGYQYNKGYHPNWARFPFPAVSCISVNSEMAHGIPTQRALREGDIVTLDLGVIDEDGNCGDAGMTLGVGKVSDKDHMLMHYAKKILYAGIEKVRNGVTIDEIARAMERKAGERNFVINRQLTGHAIGKRMHEEPWIYHVSNFYNTKKDYLEYQNFMNVTLKTGMIVCLEPHITFKDPWGVVDRNTGWTFYTKDGQNAAMFEHMIKVLDDGYEILTSHFQPFKLNE